MDVLHELGIARELTGKQRNRVFAYGQYLDKAEVHLPARLPDAPGTPLTVVDAAIGRRGRRDTPSHTLARSAATSTRPLNFHPQLPT